MWDTKSGAVLFQLKGLSGLVLYVAYSPDGKRIVACGSDRTVRFWDAETGELQPLELRGHQGDVTSVAFSPDQTRVVTGSADRTVRVWDARTGSVLLELKGLAGDVTRVAFSRDGTSIVAAVNVYGTKSEVVVWDAPPPPTVPQLIGSSGRIREAAFSPDGALLITCEYDFTVKVWDTKTGAMLYNLSGLKNDVRFAKFTPDGTRIVTRALGGQQVWDVRTGKELEGEAVPNTVPGGLVSADKRLLLQASGRRVTIVSLKPDEAELVRLRRDTQPDIGRYRDGFEAARSAKDELSLRFYLKLLPAAEQAVRAAQLAEDRGQKDEAIAFYRKAVELDPRNPDLLVTLGRLLLSAGKKDEGLALYLRAIEHEPLVAARVGPELRKAGQQEGAVACYRKALERVPQRVELHDGLAGLLAGLGRADEYLTELRKLVELDPKNHRRHSQLGSHLWIKGQRKEAFACYVAADDLEPRLGYYSRAVCLLAWFGLDQELAATRARLLAVAKAPDGSAKRGLAVLACCLKPNPDRAQRDDALALARAALSADKNIWTLQSLGIAEYRCGNFAAAVDALRRSIDMAGLAGQGYEHTTVVSGLYLAMALFQQGKKDDARATATRAAATMMPLPKEGDDARAVGSMADFLVQWLAYKEAKALIGFGAAP